jgi:hypothetical protein
VLKGLLVVRREVLVKALVRASKKGDVYEVAGLAGRVSELDELVDGNFEARVELNIREIENGG